MADNALPESLCGRLFLAAWPSPNLHKALRPFDYWVERVDWLRATPPSHRHITLVFLGEQNDTAAARALEVASAVAHEHAPIDAQAAGLRALPAPAKLRVIALELADDAHALATLIAKLHHQLASALASDALRKAADRPLLPHITLARARRRCYPKPADLAQAPAPAVSLRIERLALVRSTLAPTGPRYETLAQFALGST